MENELTSFINDDEKMYDFFCLTKQEFLNSYSYLAEQEYNKTVKELNEETLADLMRSAENTLLDDEQGINVAEYKSQINSYAEKHLTPEKYQEFVENCDNMGC